MATILSQGRKTLKTDLEEMFEALQEQRTAVLSTVRELQLASQLLGAMEARRLAAKAGADDPRVASLAARNATILERVGALDVELEVAAVRTPPVSKTETLVHGRIMDEQARAAGRMKVALVDEKGESVAGVPPVETDDAGYYAFVLTPEQVQALGANRKLSVQVQRDDVKLAPAAAQAFTLAPGTVAVNEFKLGAAELEKLHLRADLGGTTPVRPGAVVTPVVPRAAARKAAKGSAPAAGKSARGSASAAKKPARPGGDKPGRKK